MGKVTNEEIELGKKYLLSEIDRVSNDANMPASKKVIAQNYLRKLYASLFGQA